MGGNWNLFQNLNEVTGKVEWPTGPLVFDGNLELPKFLEAWVLQGENGSTGTSQRTVQSQFGVPGWWTADGIPPGWIQGNFQAGPALGIALLAWHDGATNTDGYKWWLDVITLA
jgi:hypothetical protein